MRGRITKEENNVIANPNMVIFGTKNIMARSRTKVRSCRFLPEARNRFGHDLGADMNGSDANVQVDNRAGSPDRLGNTKMELGFLACRQ